MKKQFITISLPKNTTKDEIKEIRELFAMDEKYKNYRLNLIISGNDKFKENLKDFIQTLNKS